MPLNISPQGCLVPCACAGCLVPCACAGCLVLCACAGCLLLCACASCLVLFACAGCLAGPGLPCWPWAFWQVVRFLSASLVLGFVAGVGFLACCCCCWVVSYSSQRARDDFESICCQHFRFCFDKKKNVQYSLKRWRLVVFFAIDVNINV